MNEDVERDWSWSDGYLPEIFRILKANAFKLIEFQIASDEQDVKQATDMTITIKTGTSIAVRVRRSQYQYRDLTIRAWRAGGIDTELKKIRQGYAAYYLYGWTDGNFKIPEWLLVDIDRVRSCGLLENRPLIKNKDGRTAFIAINYQELIGAGCLLAGVIHGAAL